MCWRPRSSSLKVMAPASSSTSSSRRKPPAPPCHYPLVGQATAVLCGLDILVTTVLLLCNTGTPVFSDWAHLWNTQVRL